MSDKIPFREWAINRECTLEGKETNHGADWNRAEDWTTDHYSTCMIGHGKDSGSVFWCWSPIAKGQEAFILNSGEEICSVKVCLRLQSALVNTQNVTSFVLEKRIMQDPLDPNEWDPLTCSGRYYKNTSQYSQYPHKTVACGSTGTIEVADFPKGLELWFTPVYGNPYQEHIFRNGFWFKTANYAAPGGGSWPGDWGNGDHFKVLVICELIHVRYLNPYVNSFSRYYAPSAGGVEVKLYGLGFNNSDSLIKGSGSPPAYNDEVDKIYFENLDGSITYTLNRGAGDFVVNSNELITISAGKFPAMLEGSYDIKLKKENVNVSGGIDVESYAGDWKTDEEGRIIEGDSRINFLISDTYKGDITDPRDPQRGKVISLMSMKEETKTGVETETLIAPIDTRTPSNRFYEGRLSAFGGFKRSISDHTGLFSVADTTMDLANTDKKYSKLKATSYMKNRVANIFVSRNKEAEGWKKSAIRMLIDDYNTIGPTFRVMLKDRSCIYLRRKIPLYHCTHQVFPNLHESALYRAEPEVLGHHTWTGENPGAIEALYVDTEAHKYLAAHRSMYSIDQVYSEGEILQTPTHYVVEYGEDGRTYIKCSDDHGENTITYNGKGYPYTPWNSENGFIQNPILILAYFLYSIVGFPVDVFNMDSFATLAQAFIDLGLNQAGKYAITELNNIDIELGKLLMSYGISFYPDKYGRYTVGIKNLNAFDTDLLIFAKRDTIDHPVEMEGLTELVNVAEYKWDYCPAPGVFKGVKEISDEESRERNLETLEPTQPWEFPWVSEQYEEAIEYMVRQRLYKMSYGNKKVAFSLPLEWEETIDLFKSFKLQNDYGVNADGEPEKSHYYYVSSINHDPDGGKLDIIGSDLHFLLKQWSVRQSRDEIPSLWTDAQEPDRMYKYTVRRDDGVFSDGELAKKRIGRTRLNLGG